MIEDAPEVFDEGEARSRFPPRKEESMNIILLQELNRFNTLIKTIRGNLENIKDALEGNIVFSFELEESLNTITVNKVPKVWMNESYPSLKPLPGYLENLRERVSFFSKWVEEGKPARYWISGFYFPQGFLTGILQNYARKTGIAIDKLVYDFEVIPDSKEITEGPEDGAYINGYFLEGARFCQESLFLEESLPKVLFSEGPTLFLRPVLVEDLENDGDFYECPLYRTGDRRGVLMTTGHSTNFVMVLRLPSSLDHQHWVKRGVAALTQLND